MIAWNQIAEHIGGVTGKPFHIQRQRPLNGGCINTASLISDGRRSFFVKLNAIACLTMFEAESAGLRALAAARAIRVPQPICTGITHAHSYLVTDYLELSGRLDSARAGQQLAQLHRASAEHFGWHRDNTIGITPQPNTPHANWVGFWRDQRLGYQLQLAAASGHGGKLLASGERLLLRLDAFLGHQPPPSLLHGDLWAGNIGALPDGEPVIFDPAVYYGDRETDLAMTELFGGFDARFQSAYRDAWPLDAGYATRKILYNLYHVLNHLNLFGGGYRAQAQQMIEWLLAEVG